MIYTTKSQSAKEISLQEIKELTFLNISDEQKAGTQSDGSDSESESTYVVSATGYDDSCMPEHGTENYPAVLQCICLRYTGMKSIDTLVKAVTKRLGNKPPTFSSTQPDGAATLFFVLQGIFPLFEDKNAVEKQLNDWVDAHGLRNIGGAQLDEDHYLRQLEEPTFVGKIEDFANALFPLSMDRLYRRRATQEFLNMTLRYNKEHLLAAIEEAGWSWEEPREDCYDGVGRLTTDRGWRLPAVMTPEAFYVFGGDIPLFPYHAIVGDEQWALLAAEAKDRVICDCYYYTVGDKEHYLICNPDGEIRDCVYGEFLYCLKAFYQLSSDAIKNVVAAVTVAKKVTGVRKQAYCPQRIIIRDSETYVNNSTVKLLQPNLQAPSDRYKQRCPSINTLLNSLFGANSDELEVFLSWLAIAYQGAYYGRPQRGHALYLVGVPGTGKSLLRELVGMLFGRSRSGQEFFCEGTQFNAYTLEDNPLVYLDDASVDWKNAAKMHNRIKELVASGVASINAKYEAQRHVEWYGRIMVTCNPSGEGNKLIPEVTEDNKDKFIILKTSNRQLQDQKLGQLARKELADFAHFLKFYRSPLMNNCERFGMKEYISPGIREATIFRDGEGSLMECLRSFLNTASGAGKSLNFTTTELYHELSQHEMTSSQVAELCTPKNLGRKLVKMREALEQNVMDFPFTMEQQRTSVRRSWVFTPKPSETPGEEDEEQEETPPQA